MRILFIFLSLTLASLMNAPVHAGNISDFGAKADALMESSDPIGAIEALDAAMEEIWKRSPLTFRKALFVDSATGFGVYAERENAVFKSEEPLVIYAEPIGYAYGKNAIGSEEIHLLADFKLTDMEDKELFYKEDFLKLVLPVRYHNREFHMNMTVRMDSLPEGKYKAMFRIRDKHSEKSGNIVLPFEKVN